MTASQLGLAFDERDRCVDVVDRASDQQDRAVIDQAIREVGLARGTFSASDVRPLLPRVRPALMGARFLAAVRRGDIEKVGYVTSTDPGTHARPIADYRFRRWTG